MVSDTYSAKETDTKKLITICYLYVTAFTSTCTSSCLDHLIQSVYLLLLVPIQQLTCIQQLLILLEVILSQT